MVTAQDEMAILIGWGIAATTVSGGGSANAKYMSGNQIDLMTVPPTTKYAPEIRTPYIAKASISRIPVIRATMNRASEKASISNEGSSLPGFASGFLAFSSRQRAQMPVARTRG